jgi:hypothetical protein
VERSPPVEQFRRLKVDTTASRVESEHNENLNLGSKGELGCSFSMALPDLSPKASPSSSSSLPHYVQDGAHIASRRSQAENRKVRKNQQG